MNVTPLSPMDVGVVLSTLASAAQDYNAIAERNSGFPEIQKSMLERANMLLDVAKRFELVASAADTRARPVRDNT